MELIKQVDFSDELSICCNGARISSRQQTRGATNPTQYLHCIGRGALVVLQATYGPYMHNVSKIMETPRLKLYKGLEIWEKGKTMFLAL